MTDTNSLRTGAGYALEVGLYATYKAMTEAADTIDTLRAALASAAQLAPPAVVAGPVAWIRKNGIRFNAEAEPQDDSETALYSQTDIDTLRAQLAEAKADNKRLRSSLSDAAKE